MNADTLNFVDIGLRMAAMGMMVLVLGVGMLGKALPGFKAASVLMVAGAFGYLIASSPLLYPATAGFRPIILFWAQTSALWFWLFAHYLFDAPVPKRLFAALLAIFVVLWVLSLLVTELVWWISELREELQHILAFLLVGHILYLIVTGRRDDLVESRRRFRLWLVISIGLLVGAIVAIETLFNLSGISGGSTELAAIAAGAVLLNAFFAGLTLLQADSQIVAQADAATPSLMSTDQFSPSETVLHEKLTEAMHGGYYRTANLTIQALASHLGSPEHRLRALINGRLGHRNFSSFLNGHRITEAKAKLADRELVDLPILTIAMDLGYGSLSSFNRAFRAETGLTPSDFRKAAIDQN